MIMIDNPICTGGSTLVHGLHPHIPGNHGSTKTAESETTRDLVLCSPLPLSCSPLLTDLGLHSDLGSLCRSRHSPSLCFGFIQHPTP